METYPDGANTVVDVFAQWKASFESLRCAERRLVQAIRSTSDRHEIDRLSVEVDALRSSSTRLFARAEFSGAIQQDDGR